MIEANKYKKSATSNCSEGKEQSCKVVVGKVMISMRSNKDVIHVGSLVTILIISKFNEYEFVDMY